MILSKLMKVDCVWVVLCVIFIKYRYLIYVLLNIFKEVYRVKNKKMICYIEYIDFYFYYRSFCRLKWKLIIINEIVNMMYRF